MINIEKYDEIVPNANETKKILKSVKNDKELEYYSEEERTSMILAEFDSSVDSYCQFDFEIIKRIGGKTLETAPGLILRSDSETHYIIFSQLLEDNKDLAQDVCQSLHKNDPLLIDLAVISPGKLIPNVTSKNIDFLYQHALLSRNYEDFLKIQSLFELYEEVKIGQLRKQVTEVSSIYQLMFFHGLRADIDSSEINDDLLVYPSPLLRSIIQSL